MVTVSQMPCLIVTSQPTREITSADIYQDETVLDTEISNVLNSVKDLLKKYRMYSKASESNVVSGGLQQYLIRQLKQKHITDTSARDHLQALYVKDMSMLPDDVYNSQAEYTTARFSNLPVNLKLHIFSFLSARHLSQASRVCRDWRQLTSDELLWQDRLQLDLPKWNCISHTSNPQLYQDTDSELTAKEIYCKCSPEVRQCLRQELSTFHHVSQVLKYILPKKAPKVAMFGPGLESKTSGLVRKMLYEDNTYFQRVALFPGQFEGMGAGMTLKLTSGNNVHLTVLYSAPKREREARGNNRLSGNRLLNKTTSGGEDGASESYELQQSLKDLCHTLDAFVFVVDATESIKSVKSGQEELFAMIHERWSSPRVPLLVLSCIPETSCHRLPAIDIVETLNLGDLSRPWMVLNAEVSNLSEVERGIQWIINQSQYS